MDVLYKNFYNSSQDRPKHVYSKGEVIPNNYHSIWLVCQGLVKLSTIAENGNELILGLIGSEMPFGSALTSIETYQATVFSNYVELICTSFSEIAASPLLAQAFLPKIKRRLQQTESFLALYRQRRAIDRLQNLLLLLKQEFGEPVAQGTRLSVRLTHNDLASACGITRVTTTRLLGKLHQKRKITFDCHSHIILLCDVFESIDTDGEFCDVGEYGFSLDN